MGGQAITRVVPWSVRAKKSGTTLRSLPRSRHLIFAEQAVNSVTAGVESQSVATAGTFTVRQPTCLPVVEAHHHVTMLR